MTNPYKLTLSCILAVLLLSGCGENELGTLVEDTTIYMSESAAATYTGPKNEHVKIVITPDAVQPKEPAVEVTAPVNTEETTKVEEPVKVPVVEPTKEPIKIAAKDAQVKGYDNTIVRTTLNNTRYTADGSKVKLNGKVVVDLSTVTTTQINPEMAQLFFITDLASKVEENDIAIYVTGLTFNKRNVNYNNTAEYYNQMVNVGSPYTIVYKHFIKANKTYVLMCQRNYGVWTAKHYDTQFNEAKAKEPDDSIYTGDGVLIDFLAPSIFPHMTLSRDGKYLYMINGMESEDDKFKMNIAIGIVKLSTSHKVSNPVLQTWFEMKHYEEFFKQYGYHHVDIHMFYPKEQDDGAIALASIGQPDSKISTSYTIDPNTLNTIKGYWRDRNEVMSLVED